MMFLAIIGWLCIVAAAVWFAASAWASLRMAPPGSTHMGFFVAVTLSALLFLTAVLTCPFTVTFSALPSSPETKP